MKYPLSVILTFLLAFGLLLSGLATATVTVAPLPSFDPPSAPALPGSPEEAIEAADVLLLARRLEAGADPNRADANGVTPLMLAAAKGRVELVLLLLDHGAAPDATLETGLTVSDFARMNRHADVLRLLCERGAEPLVNDNDPSSWFLGPGFDLPMPRPSPEDWPLHAAARRGDAARLLALLDSGADVNATDAYGTTALQVAAEAGHEAALRLVLERGAETDAVASGCGRTALFWAAGAGHVACMQLLLDHGASPDVRDAWNKTALHQAARQGHTEAIRLLVKAGAQVDGRREKHKGPVIYLGGEDTPLHLAIRGGHEEAAFALLALGASPDAPDDDGNKALLVAVRHKCYGLISFLATQGFSPQAIEENVREAIELARQMGDEKALRILGGEQDWEE